MRKLRFFLLLAITALALLASAGGSFHAPAHDLALAPADVATLGADASDQLGQSVAAGDFNGDGIDDLLLGAALADAASNLKSAAGEAYVIFGSPTLSGTKDLAALDQNLTVLGADAGDLLGVSVAAGDFNGDGIDDLLLGAPTADAAGNLKSDAGEAYVIFGSPTLSGTKDLAALDQNLTVLGADANDHLGQSVAAGDFNGDGIDDLLVGAFAAGAAGNAKASAGEAYVVFGSTTLSGTKDIAASPQDLTVLGADAGDELGLSVAAGDFNGDAIDDLLLGARGADAAGNAKASAGEAYVVFGRCAAGTADSDTDGLCDPFDPNDDNDGLPDASDPCPLNAEDLDGFQDADGCPEYDNDLDGICDSHFAPAPPAGATCTIPTITSPPYPAGGSPDRCGNVPEDYDSFLDLDGCPEPDNDGDTFPDSTDQCPATDASLGPDGLFETADDASFPDPREDFDGILDTDGCHDSPCDDFDGDSFGRTRDGCPIFSDEREVALGTNPGRACAADSTPDNESPDPQPEDFNDDGAVTGADLSAIAGVIGQTVPPAPVRRDLNLDGAIAGADLSLVAGRIGLVCVPPGASG